MPRYRPRLLQMEPQASLSLPPVRFLSLSLSLAEPSARRGRRRSQARSPPFSPLRLSPCKIACTVTSASLLPLPLACSLESAPPGTAGSSPPPGCRRCGCPCVRGRLASGHLRPKPSTSSVPSRSGGASAPLLGSHHRRQHCCRRADTCLRPPRRYPPAAAAPIPACGHCGAWFRPCMSQLGRPQPPARASGAAAAPARLAGPPSLLTARPTGRNRAGRAPLLPAFIGEGEGPRT